jgi:hypothetical protein
MAGQSYRHLRSVGAGGRVAVDTDDEGRRFGILVAIRPNGVQVRLDGEERRRTVAAWRVTKA